MPEASSRVLLDRTTIRLDGRAFFAFGARLYLTPLHKIRPAIAELAAAGFNCVSSPPASPGNLAVLNELFDAAEEHGLLVILMSEAWLPSPARFLASNFKHRKGLHSYCLMTRDGTLDCFEQYVRERNHLRTQDLFHPIWTPHRPEFPLRRWLDSVDIHSVAHGTGGPFPRTSDEDGAEKIRSIVQQCAGRTVGRPLFCHSLQVGVSDMARQAGLYSFDPEVRSVPFETNAWYPYLAEFGDTPRWDFLAPDADLLRVRVFELLARRARGIVADFYEFLRGEVPFTGRDRFCELAVMAHETGALGDFFAEGQLVHGNVETGHPRLKGGILHHGDDVLVVLWRSGEGDEFWMDPSSMSRVEVSLELEAPEDMKAWCMDFPAARESRIIRDTRGRVRILLEGIELTSLVLLTRGSQRSQALASELDARLPRASRFFLEGMRFRLAKVRLVEKELQTLGSGLRQDARLLECEQAFEDAESLVKSQHFAEAWALTARLGNLLRTLINRQMVETLARAVTRDSRLDLLRRNYYTLPQYYREITTISSSSIPKLRSVSALPDGPPPSAVDWVNDYT